MRHRKSGRKLSRKPSHRHAMLKGLVSDLIRHEQLQTTDARAKELRPIVEKVITLGKRGDIHARRLAARVVRDDRALSKLFNDIGPRFKDRPGGYTRITKVGHRPGDNAPVSLIALVDIDAHLVEGTSTTAE
jgi:large subunit ribosomal protein L17